MNKSLVKAIMILGGGFLVYLLVKPKNAMPASSAEGEKKNFDNSVPAPNPENAEIVKNAYTEALKNGEPPTRLTELNKECMKEFGMRCYVQEGKVIVCDVKGETVLTA